jgi:hypothetical protein
MEKTQNELREIIRDYLNGNFKEEELLNIFELKKCGVCDQVELEEDMEHHKWDLGMHEELICQSCKGDE